MALKCTNTSGPDSCEMKPKPFSALNHLTTPTGTNVPPDEAPPRASDPRQGGGRKGTARSGLDLLNPSMAHRTRSDRPDGTRPLTVRGPPAATLAGRHPAVRRTAPRSGTRSIMREF